MYGAFAAFSLCQRLKRTRSQHCFVLHSIPNTAVTLTALGKTQTPKSSLTILGCLWAVYIVALDFSSAFWAHILAQVNATLAGAPLRSLLALVSLSLSLTRFAFRTFLKLLVCCLFHSCFPCFVRSVFLNCLFFPVLAFLVALSVSFFLSVCLSVSLFLHFFA